LAFQSFDLEVIPETRPLH